MRRLAFGPEQARSIDAHGSQGFTIAPMTRPLAAGAPFQAACFRLEPGGRIGLHAATVPQLLAVTEGTGWVRGGDGQTQPIAAGQAAFWAAGEMHETGTETGLTAIVIESPEIHLPPGGE